MKKLRSNQIQKAAKYAALLREKMQSDAARPGYHFATPGDYGLPGDANMAFYARGKYHLMYLYKNMADGYRVGHLVSVDLVHWRLLGDALGPDELDGGIFSGGAFVDEDGTAYISYWALPPSNAGHTGGIRIAKSTDAEHDYLKWEKFDELAVKAGKEVGITDVTNPATGETDYLGCTDPSNIWRAGGKYYMELGALVVLNKFRGKDAPDKYRGDWVELYSSDDLKSWKHEGRFYRYDKARGWTDDSEDDMCPSFLPLSYQSGEPSGKYLQLFIAHNRGCQYYIGSYDPEGKPYPFVPERHGRMSIADNAFFAPEALVDDRGRQIMWAWLRDDRYEGDDEQKMNGWCGVFCLPRALALGEDGELLISPVEELRSLRYGKTNDLAKVNPVSCEIELRTSTPAKKTGARIRYTASEYADVYFDVERSEIVFDASAAEGGYNTGKVERMPLALKAGEELYLDIFVDRSVIEVFACGRQAVCRRVYFNGKHTPSIEKIGDAALTAYNIFETNLF